MRYAHPNHPVTSGIKGIIHKQLYDKMGGMPGGPVKYDIVHMGDKAFSKLPLNEFGSLPQKKT